MTNNVNNTDKIIDIITKYFRGITISVYLTIVYIVSNLIDSSVLMYNKYIITGLIIMLVYLVILVILLLIFFKERKNSDEGFKNTIKIILVILFLSVVFKVLYSYFLVDDSEVKNKASKYYIIISDFLKGILLFFIVFNIFNTGKNFLNYMEKLKTQEENEVQEVQDVQDGGRKKYKKYKKRKVN